MKLSISGFIEPRPRTAIYKRQISLLDIGGVDALRGAAPLRRARPRIGIPIANIIFHRLPPLGLRPSVLLISSTEEFRHETSPASPLTSRGQEHSDPTQSARSTLGDHHQHG